MPKNKQGKMSKGKMLGIGAGAAALGAAAYYFLGPDGKKHQKSAKKWMADVQEKIIKKLENTKEVTEYVYEDIVNDIVKPYMARGVATAKEVEIFTKDLKKNWKNVVAAARKNTNKRVKNVKTNHKSKARKKNI
jgi:gas vesicle protein